MNKQKTGGASVPLDCVVRTEWLKDFANTDGDGIAKYFYHGGLHVQAVELLGTLYEWQRLPMVNLATKDAIWFAWYDLDKVWHQKKMQRSVLKKMLSRKAEEQLLDGGAFFPLSGFERLVFEAILKLQVSQFEKHFLSSNEQDKARP